MTPHSTEYIIAKRWQSPAGDLLIGSFGDALVICEWADSHHIDTVCRRISHHLHADFRDGNSATIDAAITQLEEYFAGTRQDFSLPLILCGTEFQRRVWLELCDVPYATTLSYSEIAHGIGKPQSVRAVANAIGANAISIFIPCHRIIGADGSLTGFAGGLAAKTHLLNLEFKTRLRPGQF